MSKSPSSTLNARKDHAIFVLLALTFAGLIVDVRYEHRDVLGRYWESWFPLAAGLLGVIACVLCLTASLRTRWLSALLFVLVALIGFGGVYEHTSLHAYMFTRYFVNVDPHLKGLGRPTWAPLAFTMLGVIGLILVWPSFRWPRSNEK